MSQFTAILGTALCRPGNIVLASESSAAPKMAAAVLVGLAAVTAAPAAHLTAHTALAGTSAVVAPGNIHHAAHAALVGVSTIRAASGDLDSSACSIAGAGHFFIDPGKTILHSFFGPPTVAPNFRAPRTEVRPYHPGTPPPPSNRISPLATFPKKTKTGGVPSEG